ncbi:MAG: methylmalonyl Co-A mutase-associated GTPase MeaB [Rhodospirillaceae bacterium]|nr:methylmalonyl Co-A mutase-associated GTPase MeaB [Rhodospirillaceae bacterium]
MTDATPNSAEAAALAEARRAGDRRALARAITLVESARPDHRAAAEALLEAVLPHGGPQNAQNARSMRLGISGPPGVGKSTFIEALGLHLIAAGHKVAVLAVDPSSKRSGGSILGDKTRMEGLGREATAFIRPSPAGETLGGVARRTREAMLVCEAAGFDVVLIETVGVGQSETAVAEMVDMFLLLVAPGGGDELQGIKRGIAELADLVVVTKSDGGLAEDAGRIAADYQAALHLLRPSHPGWRAEVARVSSIEGRGIAEVWAIAERFRAALVTEESDGIAAQRAEQAKTWLWRELREGLVEALRADPEIRRRLPDLEKAVATGRTTPAAAARELLAVFRSEKGD